MSIIDNIIVGVCRVADEASEVAGAPVVHGCILRDITLPSPWAVSSVSVTSLTKNGLLSCFDSHSVLLKRTQNDHGC